MIMSPSVEVVVGLGSQEHDDDDDEQAQDIAVQSGQSSASLPINKSTSAAIGQWLWQTITWPVGGGGGGGASQADSPQAATTMWPPATTTTTTTTSTTTTANSKLLWPSKCLEFARMFASSNGTLAGDNQARSAAELEHLIREQLRGGPSASSSPVRSSASSSGSWPIVAVEMGQQQPVHSGSQQQQQLELFECYNQLQLVDYYQAYDLFVGLRIATTLSILFVVFILFVIYKTNCRDGKRTSRSQLRLASNYNNNNTKVIRRTQQALRQPAASCPHEQQSAISTSTSTSQAKGNGDPGGTTSNQQKAAAAAAAASCLVDMSGGAQLDCSR